MSKQNITYVISCGRGLRKDMCPVIVHGDYCVECNFARYIPRQYSSTQEEVNAEESAAEESTAEEPKSTN